MPCRVYPIGRVAGGLSAFVVIGLLADHLSKRSASSPATANHTEQQLIWRANSYCRP